MTYEADPATRHLADALEREHGLPLAVLVARRRSRALPDTRETRQWGAVTTELVGRQLALRP